MAHEMRTKIYLGKN